MERLDAEIQNGGAVFANDPETEGTIGTTMFDLPGSEDNTVTVLLPRHNAQTAPSQSLVRIKSRKGGDGKSYLGIVTAGPFSEPDSLRADSHLLVTVATRGGSYQPPFHGRIQVTILGEELGDGTLCPPRLRPLPNSLVYSLSDQESAKVLNAAGDIRIGQVVGYENVAVGIPSDLKSVLPRHTAVLGTTGGGKSTTIARLVQQAQAANMAVILLDVEGEYTHLHEPTTNNKMRTQGRGGSSGQDACLSSRRPRNREPATSQCATFFFAIRLALPLCRFRNSRTIGATANAVSPRIRQHQGDHARPRYLS
jgi:DNA helicase HerA-like ATPase